MAKNKKNIVTKGLSGALNKQIVFKQYKNFQVVGKYPNMDGIIPSEGQKKQRSLMGKAATIASEISNDPVKSAPYRETYKNEETTLYKFILKDIMKKMGKNEP